METNNIIELFSFYQLQLKEFQVSLKNIRPYIIPLYYLLFPDNNL